MSVKYRSQYRQLNLISFSNLSPSFRWTWYLCCPSKGNSMIIEYNLTCIHNLFYFMTICFGCTNPTHGSFLYKKIGWPPKNPQFPLHLPIWPPHYNLILFHYTQNTTGTQLVHTVKDERTTVTKMLKNMNLHARPNCALNISSKC